MSAPTYPAYKESGFEWFGDVPVHWTVTRLKYLGEAIIGLTYDPSQVVDGDFGTLVLRSSNVQKGKINLGDNVYVDATIPPDLITRIGDILICSRNGSRALIGKNATIDALSVGQTFGAFMTIFRSRHSRYVSWLLNSPLFEFQSGAFLTSTINQLTVGVLNNFEVPLPPEAERDTIVAFLDRETGKIDALVAEQERLISLLKEKRQAVISHAVTKGLNPKAPMKDSGVPWLGEVPAHWEIKRLGWVCKFTSGKAHEPFLDEDGEYLCVTARFISTNGRSARRCSKNLSPARQGDILMVMSDLPNGRALARTYKTSNSGILAVNQRVCIVSLYQGNPAFFDYQLDRNPGLLQHDDGINQTHLSNSEFTSLLLLVPPCEEQDHIAEGLDATTARLDILSDDATRAITLLRERRAALISAAVTGKIDVRDTVPAMQNVA